MLTCTCHPQPSRRPGSHSAPRRWRSKTARRESCGSLAGKNGDHHQHQGRGAGSHNVCRGKHGPVWLSCTNSWNSYGKLGKKEQYSSPQTGPQRASGTPDGLIRNPPGPSRSAHTPWGHCDRLGCSGMTCTRRSQPSRRPRTPRRWCERWRSEAARWGSYG